MSFLAWKQWKEYGLVENQRKSSEDGNLYGSARPRKTSKAKWLDTGSNGDCWSWALTSQNERSRARR